MIQTNQETAMTTNRARWGVLFALSLMSVTAAYSGYGPTASAWAQEKKATKPSTLAEDNEKLKGHWKTAESVSPAWDIEFDPYKAAGKIGASVRLIITGKAGYKGGIQLKESKDRRFLDLGKRSEEYGLPSTIFYRLDGESLIFTVDDGKLKGEYKLERVKNEKAAEKKSKTPQLEVKTVDEWIQILKTSKDNRERQKAANALGTFGAKAKSAIPVLIDALKKREPFVPDQAATALVRIGKDSIPALKETLKANEDRARERAAWTLAKFPRDDLLANELTEPLIDLLKNDKDTEVRRGAARALGQMRAESKTVVPFLAAGLKDKESNLDCVYALAEYGKEAKPAVPELLAIFNDKEKDGFLRENVARTLAAIGADAKEAVPSLVAALKDPEKHVRLSAESALKKIDPEAAKKAGFTGPFFTDKIFLRGHNKPTYAVGFDPNAATLISVSNDNTVKVWDLKTGKERISFSVPEDEAYTFYRAAFSLDGKSVAIGGGKHPIVWDTETGKERYKLVDYYSGSAVVFSPDGKTIAYGTGFKGVYLCDAKTGKKRVSLVGGLARILAFSPDGKTFASADDKAVSLWNATTGKLIATLKQPQAAWLAFAADGKTLLTTATDRLLRTWDTDSAKELRSVKIGDAYILALSPDGKILVGPSSTRPFAIDATTGKSLAVSIGSPRQSSLYSTPAFSRDGRLLAAGYVDGGIQVWEASQ
jgi:HEAT repeat protein